MKYIFHRYLNAFREAGWPQDAVRELEKRCRDAGKVTLEYNHHESVDDPTPIEKEVREKFGLNNRHQK